MGYFQREEPKNKFHARKVTIDGMEFDSQAEAYRWCELKLMEKAGEIRELRRQVEYTLIPSQKGDDGKVAERAVKYIADFVYEENGKTVVEDVKGLRQGAAYEVFKIKRKLMRYVHGIEIREIVSGRRR